MSSVINVFDLDFPWQTQDPFLFCVYHKDDFPKGNGKSGPKASLVGRNIGQDFNSVDGWNMYHGETVPGFPAHPHRGFETITVVNEGIVDHADSLNAAGRYGGGDTQWMTAGKGVQHSEMFPLVNEEKGNPLVLFQIWINLPPKNKMVEPHFAMLWGKDTPVVECADVKGKVSSVKIIAGGLNGYRPPSPPPESWANDPENGVWVWNIKMPNNAQFTLPASSVGLNRVLYFYKGQVATVQTTPIKTQQGVQLMSDAEVILHSGDEACEFLLLQGRPIDEPVARYGPFVMNTEQEIQQAFSDYREDQFGGWPWPNTGPVHFGAKGRFAKHADGTLEEPDV
jgi:redox-sensitive bicupin YhaK (pirin superfamily)